jgi:hypothetical protein
VRIAMVHGTADPERDGVAGCTAELGAALGAAGIEVAAAPGLSVDTVDVALAALASR